MAVLKVFDGSIFVSILGDATDHGALLGLGDDDHNIYLLAAGTRVLTADWDAGPFKIRARTFQSDVATGTAPLIVASITLVTNLYADLLDGVQGSGYSLADGTRDFTGVVIGVAPSLDLHLATKKYVDDNAADQTHAQVMSRAWTMS